MDSTPEFQESTLITFEWTLRGLKDLFDSTKGDTKSKVTKSAHFGGGRWQILFYANAGPGTKEKDGGVEGGFVSLYLSCEPTAEEKEVALADSGRWVREGVYKFRLEVRDVGKTVLYNEKEAHNHTFSFKTANWGWAQFLRRDSVYYQPASVRKHDAFVIICTITSSPTSPPRDLPLPQQLVPKDLVETIGEMLDDPTYSDVQFILPRRGNLSLNGARAIWAAKRLLRRASYFDAMFRSGFKEGSNVGVSLSSTPNPQRRAVDGYTGSIMDEFEDSDDEDGDVLSVDEPLSTSEGQSSHALSSAEAPNALLLETIKENHDIVEHQGMDIQISTSTPTSPSQIAIEQSPAPETDPTNYHGKMTVIVRDVAYTTYRAILYYIYTNNIVFAPLSSSFHPNRNSSGRNSTPKHGTAATLSEAQGQTLNSKRVPAPEFATRGEWIRDWMEVHPGRPAPCSAKAIYRVADRLDLNDLKERAKQHIIRSLTEDNIAYEVFSPFAAAFDDIRKVEVDYFLAQWHDIRVSDSMRNVWKQIRNGRHPGFEEVWPQIAANLEFKPSVKEIL